METNQLEHVYGDAILTVYFVSVVRTGRVMYVYVYYLCVDACICVDVCNKNVFASIYEFVYAIQSYQSISTSSATSKPFPRRIRAISCIILNKNVTSNQEKSKRERRA